MKSPIERTHQTDKCLFPKRGEGNQISKNIPQSETTYLNSSQANKERLEESIGQLERGEIVETTYNSEIGEVKRHD